MNDPNLDFFAVLSTLDSAGRSEVKAWSQTIHIPEGTVIYSQDQNSDGVFVISSGTVEAITTSPDGLQTRSLAVMGRGEVFGEVEVLSGNLRQGTVMAREDCELIRFELVKFFHVMHVVPQIGLFINRTLARRLWMNTAQNTLNTLEMELSGHLQYFDLLTIFQAIIRAGHPGEMTLLDKNQNVIGSYFFEKARVAFGRFNHLQGVEAVWQGFIQAADANADCTFTFNVQEKPELEYQEAHAIRADIGDLLLEGVMKRDAFNALPAELRAMEGRVQRLDENLNWSNPETEASASVIWGLLAKRPQPIQTLWRRLNISALTFLQIIREMLSRSKISIVPEGRAEESTGA